MTEEEKALAEMRAANAAAENGNVPQESVETETRDIETSVDLQKALSDMKADNAVAEDGHGSQVGMVTETRDTKAPEDMHKVFGFIEDANRITALLFQELGRVDQQFNEKARIFFNTADKISQSMKRNDDDQTMGVIINTAIGFVTLGVGSIVSWVKTENTLNTIRQRIVKELGRKMEGVNENYAACLDICNDALDRWVNFPIDGNLKDYIGAVNDYRMAQYAFDLQNYIIDVYNSALAGEFTSLTYPTLFSVNLGILAMITNSNLDDFRGSEEIRRGAIGSFVEGMIDKLKNNQESTFDEDLLASDNQLMALAIHECCPRNDEYENGLATIVDTDVECNRNIDDLTLVSEGYYRSFVELKLLADNATTDNLLGMELHVNNALTSFYNHAIQYSAIREDYKSRVKVYNVNCLLVAVLTFIVPFFNWNLAWYWSAIIAVAGYVLARKIAPWTSLREIYHLKLTCVNRTIRAEALSSAGHTETVDLKKIEKGHKNKFWIGLAGGIIGMLGLSFIPVIGWIIGFLAGVFIAISLASDDSGEDVQIDYREVDTGKRWKSWGIMGSLVLSIVVIMVSSLFSFSGRGGTSRQELPAETATFVSEEEVEMVTSDEPEAETIAEAGEIISTVDASGLNMNGSIGPYAAEVKVGWKDGEISGEYFYLENGRRNSSVITLHGTVTNDGRNGDIDFEMYETTPQGKRTGKWIGTIMPDVADNYIMDGTFENLINGKTYDLSFATYDNWTAVKNNQ
ncbi:MAG: DUF456 domain-containing protein [Muribaculaceae bacterium]|nr:DUF456 domain-containing protein [Muribaculaceae bacterium]